MREFLRSAKGINPATNKPFVTHRTLKHLAEENPHIEFIAKKHRFKHPVVIGEYRIHEQERRVFDASNFKHLHPEKSPRLPFQVCVKNETTRHISEVAQDLRNSSGRVQSEKIERPLFSTRESIQGLWTPYVTSKTEFIVKI